jgi:ribose transport system permease protein
VGSGYEFDAVTAVVLGGMSLKGGEGSVLKTLVGALIVSMIANF